MTGSVPSLPASFADRNRLDSFLCDTLEDFRAGIDESQHTERQEMRALAVCWIATFLPEACTPPFRAELARVVEFLRARVDHRNNMWWRIAPLEAALFALTGGREWLRFLIPNLNHHSRVFRTPVIEAVGYIADRLDFDDLELRQRVLSNLSSRQALADETLLILLSSRGSASAKAAWLAAASPGLDPDDGSENAIVVGLRKDGWATNDWFPETLLEPLIFIASELARPYLKRGQMPLPLDPSEAESRPASAQPGAVGDLFEPTDLWGLLSARLKAHPLSSSIFRLPNA